MRMIGAGLLLAVLTLGAQAAGIVGALTPAVVKELESDSQTASLLIEVDTWGRAVVLHGWTRTAWQRSLVVAKIRAMPDVEVVFNYITSDADEPDLARVMNQAERLRVEKANMHDVIYDLGLHYDMTELRLTGTDVTISGPPVPLPDALGLSVKERLDVADFTSPFALQVDNYESLVILHGNVPTPKIKREAEVIAARTPGVTHVFSYINVAEIVNGDCAVAVDFAPEEYVYTVAVEHDDVLYYNGPRKQAPRYAQNGTKPAETTPVTTTVTTKVAVPVAVPVTTPVAVPVETPVNVEYD